MKTSELTIGLSVWWLCTPRGGWCIPFWVPARVVRIGKTRVTIAAPIKRGGEKETSVKPESLHL